MVRPTCIVTHYSEQGTHAVNSHDLANSVPLCHKQRQCMSVLQLIVVCAPAEDQACVYNRVKNKLLNTAARA